MMRELYSEQDLQNIQGQLKKRGIVMLIVSILFIGLLVATLLSDNHRENRPEALATVITMLLGFFLIFSWDLFIRPLRCYRKHLQAALHGRGHEVTVEFSRDDASSSVVDGVTFRDLIFLGDADKHGDRDRLFYWDAQLDTPPFKKGDMVLVRYYDRFMTGYQIL